MRAILYAFERDTKLYMWGFVARPQQFSKLGGRDLPLRVFDLGQRRAPRMASKSSVTTPSAILATAGDSRLTQQMVDDKLAFAEFLAVRSISDEDKRRLHRVIVDEFHASKQKDYGAYRDIGVLISELAKASATRRAEVRRDLLNDIWFESQQSGDGSPLLDLVFRYNPILGADEQLGLVAPRAAFDELLAVNSFVATTAGLQPLAPNDSAAYAKQLRAAFDTLNERQKRYLVNGEIDRLKLIRAWQIWKPHEQRRHLGNMGADNIDTFEQVPQVARNLEHWAGMELTTQVMLELVGFQGDMMVLEHLRSTMSDF